jgi:signal transduction histidine kinase
MSWPSIIKRNPFVLSFTVLAALTTLLMSEGSYWHARSTIAELRDTNVARWNLARLERSIANAEASQRRFLMTEEPEHLAPYNDARRSGQQALVVLDAHFADNHKARGDMATLRRLSMAKLDALDKTLRLARTSQKAAAFQLLMEGEGKDSTDDFRALVALMIDDQEALRNSSNLTLDRTLEFCRYAVAALSAVFLFALMLYLRKSDELATLQESQRSILQSAHDRLETEVGQRTTQLTDLSRHLLKAREDERLRLARNLHDDLGSLLTAAKLDAARLRSRLGPDAPEAQARLSDLVEKLNSSIALGRAIIEDLRPSTLDHLGLVATLELLASDFSQRSGIPVHTRFEPVRLKPGVELVAFRVVQEALTNLSKYADATQAWITVVPEKAPSAWVTISVRDDGVGFDPLAPSRSAFGLLGMRFRVEAEGGTMRVQSRAGEGTLIEVTMPASPEGVS